MPFVTREQVYPQFLKLGRNSNHFVWLLCEMKYFQASNGVVFAFQQRGVVTLLALEPLMREDSEFASAWKEFESELKPKVAAFVSIYTPFLKQLHALGFQSVKVGHEPWIVMENCIPRGNSGKGVRSARNQAIRSGLKVEEWTPAEIAANVSKRVVIETLLQEWESSRLLHLNGFMNATDPFAFMECRRYFILLDAEGTPRGYLVATPVPAIAGAYLEDLILGFKAPRGSSELLTLEALVALQESGTKVTSLGVVSMQGTGGKESSYLLPAVVKLLAVTVPGIATKIYNFNGLEIFRRRFAPGIWEDVHIAVKNDASSGVSDARAWLQVLGAVLCAFQPRLRFSMFWLWARPLQTLRRFPMTWAFGVISFLLFAFVNRFGALPDEVLERFSFTASAPLSEWLYRTVASDFLYFDPMNFVTCVVSLLVVLRWAEATHRRAFIFVFMACQLLLDDVINYLFIFHPLYYFQPDLFRNLVAIKDVGGSLLLATLFGLQLCQIRKHREILFTAACIAVVFGFTYSSSHLKTLILNLNHFLFLSLGYLVGKLEFEVGRRRSRAVARNKPPASKTVHVESKAGF